VLLAKLQERRGGNPQVQLISAEPRGVDPRVVVITRGGASTGEDKMSPTKTTDESGVKRTVEKTPEFDSRK
jgi:predicted ThiF/HesA family dinucleotide-utilizing enzyme